MSLQVPIRIYLNTQSTQIIVKANNGIDYSKNLARGVFVPQPIALDRIQLFQGDTVGYLWSDILNGAGAAYGIDRDTTLEALTNLGGFNFGGSGGAVTSVNGDIGIVTVDLASVLAVNQNSLIRAELNGVGYATLTDLLISNFITVKSLANLPTPVLGVINIPTKTTLFFPNEINLAGNRLSFAQDCAILGTSSETSKVTSSLGNGIALITSVGSLSIQNIALQVVPLIGGAIPIVFNLNGILEVGAAIDWNFVNVIDSNIGTIQNYANAIFLNCAFIGSTNGVTFDGTFDSIVFEGCIFRNGVSGTCITIAPTAIINRRIRFENTPIVATGANIGINVSVLATIPIEGYIAKFINFSGGGTYLVGVQPNDNKSLFIECRGVSNSASVSELYMINNVTATVVASTAVFYKVLGTTTSGVYVQRFTNTNNRATYIGALTKFFRVSAIVSANAGNNQLMVLRIAKNGVTIVSSENQSTTSGAGRSESLKSQTVVELNTNDYIEVFIQNNTATTNIVASELNLILTPLN